MGMKDDIGTVLGGLGPGLLSGIGKAMAPKSKEAPDVPTPKAPSPDSSATAKPNAYKHGGVVQKTGVALVHKGERVIPAHGPKDETIHLSEHRVVMHLRKGGLHRALGVPEGQTIPQDKMDEAKNSNNPHVRAMANLAHTMATWHHGK